MIMILQDSAVCKPR